jgi:hypothetical protein
MRSRTSVQVRGKLVHFGVELRVALEVILVHVATKSRHHLVPLGANRLHIEAFESRIVGLIESWIQERIGLGLARGRAGRIDADHLVDHVFSS